MLTIAQSMLPIINTVAGSSLTPANWQSVGVYTMACDLAALLIKPGYSILKSCSNLRTYVNWPGQLILNASRCVINRDGNCKLKSSYDGSSIDCSATQLLELIQHLKPDGVLLPLAIMQYMPAWWDTTVLPFFSIHELEELDKFSSQHGLFMSYGERDFSDALRAKTKYPGLFYVQDVPNTKAIFQLQQLGVDGIESDWPAQAAFQGIVFTHHGDLNLNDVNTSNSFSPVDEHCACPTCTLGLTQAYLHHLYQHTPLLCQRFLVQHNAYYVQHMRSQ